MLAFTSTKVLTQKAVVVKALGDKDVLAASYAATAVTLLISRGGPEVWAHNAVRPSLVGWWLDGWVGGGVPANFLHKKVAS